MKVGASASLTDAGRKRRRNEDAFVCDPPLFAIADGMGGAQAGEIASRLAAAALRERDGGEGLVELIGEANRRVYERSRGDQAVFGMGTTATAAVVDHDSVRIGHVGDSRAYLLRDGRLEQLTDDHSLVAELVRSGKLSPEEAAVHPQRSVITRALGQDPDVDVDSFSVSTQEGDLFLLCSDGLPVMVDDAEIEQIAVEHRADLKAVARALVEAANRNGGEDNITVVLFEIAAGDAAPEERAAADATRENVEPDDERTLTEFDAVPALDDAPVLGDDEPAATAAAAPLPPLGHARRRRRRRRRRTLTSVVVLILAGVAVAGGIVALTRAHFVGAQADGHVAVYEGVPWNLVGGLHLYREVYVSPLLAKQLSQTERRQLFDHSLVSYAKALAAVHAFEADIRP